MFKINNNFNDIILNIKNINTDWENIKPDYIETAYVAQKVLEKALELLGRWTINKTKKISMCSGRCGFEH